MDSAKRLYWDGGPKKIELFMAHHLKECENNPICNSLRLVTVEFEDELDAGEGNSNLKSPICNSVRLVTVDEPDLGEGSSNLKSPLQKRTTRVARPAGRKSMYTQFREKY